MILDVDGPGFTLGFAGHTLIRHAPESPFLFAGRGDPSVQIRNGFFDIQDFVSERVPLRSVRINQIGESWLLECAGNGGTPATKVAISGNDKGLILSFDPAPGLNRLWIRLHAEPEEHFWGGGEQFSHLDLAGRRFPFWVSEPGVGRDDQSWVSFQAQRDGRGGEYWNTYYPQPTGTLLARLRPASGYDRLRRLRFPPPPAL